MALTPQRIQELQQRYSGGTANKPTPTAQPTPAQQPASGSFVQGVKDQYNSIFSPRPIVNTAVGIGTAGAKTATGLIGATANLASSFASKYLPENSSINNFVQNRAKDIQYYNDNAFTTGTLGDINKTTSGKVGQTIGTIAPYFATAGLGLPAMIAADTLIGTGQTGNFTEGAKTGLVSAATGVAAPIVNALGSGTKAAARLLTGGKPTVKTAEVVAPTFGKAVAKLAGSAVKGAARGEIGDVAQNLASGETSTDIFTKGYGKYLGGAIGAAQGVKPFKADIRKLKLQDTEKNLSKEIGKAFQGTIDETNFQQTRLKTQRPQQMYLN